MPVNWRVLKGSATKEETARRMVVHNEAWEVIRGASTYEPRSLLNGGVTRPVSDVVWYQTHNPILSTLSILIGDNSRGDLGEAKF